MAQNSTVAYEQFLFRFASFPFRFHSVFYSIVHLNESNVFTRILIDMAYGIIVTDTIALILSC